MLNSDCFDGTISIGEFRTAASAFVEIWRDCSSSALPMWSWVSPPKQPWLRDHVDGYLVLEKLCLTRPHKEGDSTGGTAMEEPSCATAAGGNGDDNGDLVIDNATLQG